MRNALKIGPQTTESGGPILPNRRVVSQSVPLKECSWWRAGIDTEVGHNIGVMANSQKLYESHRAESVLQNQLKIYLLFGT